MIRSYRYISDSLEMIVPSYAVQCRYLIISELRRDDVRVSVDAGGKSLAFADVSGEKSELVTTLNKLKSQSIAKSQTASLYLYLSSHLCILIVYLYLISRYSRGESKSKQILCLNAKSFANKGLIVSPPLPSHPLLTTDSHRCCRVFI